MDLFEEFKIRVFRECPADIVRMEIEASSNCTACLSRNEWTVNKEVVIHAGEEKLLAQLAQIPSATSY